MHTDEFMEYEAFMRCEPEALPPIVDPITHAIDERILSHQKTRATWLANRHYLAQLDRALRDMELEPELGVFSWYIISATGDAKKLYRLVSLIEAAGYTTKEGPPKKGSNEWRPLYKHAECKIEVYLCFTSSVCRRVKTGTRTVQEDVYENVCTDFTSLEHAPPVLDANLLEAAL